MIVWVVCEAFVLSGDAFNHHRMIHSTLHPKSFVFASRKSAFKMLKGLIEDRVNDAYRGEEDANELAPLDVEAVLANPTKVVKGRYYTFGFSTDDREVVWRMFRFQVIP